jgi:hypothetical protein
MQVFWGTLFFNRVSIVAVRVVEALATAVNAKVEGAIADISMNKKILILQFILVSPKSNF